MVFKKINLYYIMPKKSQATKQSNVELTPESSDCEIEVTKEVPATVIKPSTKKAPVKEAPKDEAPVEVPAEDDPISEVLAHLHETLTQSKSVSKQLEANIKELENMKKKLRSKKKIERKEYPRPISKDLAKILDRKEGDLMLKAEVVRALCVYPKKNNLTCEDEKGNKTLFKLDKKLEALFKDKIKEILDSKEESKAAMQALLKDKKCSYIAVQSLVNPHLGDPVKEVASESEQE
jgi:hypothetical protein